MQKHFVLLSLSLIGAAAIAAAGSPHHLRLSARADRDSVVLRWAPTDAAGWRPAAQRGYVVERAELTPEGEVRGEFVRITKKPIVPWTRLECNFNISHEINYTAIAAQQLYSDDVTMYRADYSVVAGIPKTGDTAIDRFNIAMFCADNETICATAMGLHVVDTRPGKGSFLYRVFVNASDSPDRFDTATARVTLAPHVAAPAPTVLTAESGDHAITLRWRNNPDAPYTAFFVARSADHGASFKTLNKIPIVGYTADGPRVTLNGEYSDTSAGNYFPYRYKVFGVTMFAEVGAAVVCEGSGRDLTPPHIPKEVTAKSFGPRRVLLSWRIDTADRDCEGYFIERGFTQYSGVRLTATLLDNYKREYLDSGAMEGDAYYRIGAIDTAGNIIRSEAVKYTDPNGPESFPTNPYFPKPKHSLAASYDSTRKSVTLTWTPPVSKDRVFYLVYRRIVNSGAPVPCRRIEAHEGKFEDLYLIGPGHYEYELRVLPEDKNVDVTDVMVP